MKSFLSKCFSFSKTEIQKKHFYYTRNHIFIIPKTRFIHIVSACVYHVGCFFFGLLLTTETMPIGGLRAYSLSPSDKVNAGATPANCTSASQWA